MQKLPTVQRFFSSFYHKQILTLIKLKVMKKIFTLLFLMTMLLFARAQYGTINSMTVIPANPTTVDTVKLIADVTVGYSSCWLVGNNFNLLSPGNYMVDAFYCMGMLAALCNSTDTFTLGVLPAGTNNIYMLLRSAQNAGPDPCTVFSPLDTDVVQIFVSTSTGIPDDEIISLRIVSIDDEFVIRGAERMSNKDITLYSISGRTVYNRILTAEENKINPSLLPGIYFYRLRAGKDFYYGKLFAD